MESLKSRLKAIDGQGYKSYKSLQGEYNFECFSLSIDHVQGDSFADPSRCRLWLEQSRVQLPEALYQTPIQRIALEDFLGRRVAAALARQIGKVRGSGNSGVLRIADYGQQVLQRTALLVSSEGIEVRCQFGLPANGRRVAAGQAMRLFFEVIPAVIAEALLDSEAYLREMQLHVQSVADQHCLRAQLAANELVAFVADGAVLPRVSGIDDRPLPNAVPWLAPASMAGELVLADGRPVRGLMIPRGVSLIVGGGFHGKSTLLQALERGVYDHIPGDGRERVVTDESAVKIRAEDGRSIRRVDISPFIGELPLGRSTDNFSTDNASGSTSQAANIIEAVAAGASCLLLDEDTSASNFMIRDQRMQALVCDASEPITPLVQRVRYLYEKEAVSVVLVMGGSGDFFASADRVLMMDSYVPKDVTAQAQQLADPAAISCHRQLPGLKHACGRERRVITDSVDVYRNNGREKIQAFDLRMLRFGEQEIDTSRIEQLVDSGQLIAIGYLLRAFAHQPLADGDMVPGLRHWLQQVEAEGLDILTPYVMGSLAMPRLYELVATLNRLRSLQLVHSPEVNQRTSE